MHPIDTLSVLFAGDGSREYFGEAVSTSTHMLQAGALAERDGAPAPQIAAALLHDVGHLRSLQTEQRPHEEVGADWLAQWFPPEVTEPIRLHVAAKRYLCATEPTYFGKLSAASVESLRRQGGAMTVEETHTFTKSRYAEAATAVRRWDEAAKNPAASTPDFEHFRPLLVGLLLAGRGIQE